jgi:hypothetical protein
MAELRIRGHVQIDRPPTFTEGVEQVTLKDLSQEKPGKIVVNIEYDESVHTTPRAPTRSHP